MKPNKPEVELGDQALDKIAGFQGIVTGTVRYICVTMSVLEIVILLSATTRGGPVRWGGVAISVVFALLAIAWRPAA